MTDRLPILEVANLQYCAVTETLIRDISFTLFDPGITVIMGPNGAGKSVLIRLLHGLLQPKKGLVLWRGKPLDLNVRRRQSMVFQKPVLLRRSVAANIDFVLSLDAKNRQQTRDRILREADLYNQKAQPARQLSGGEQQRLALVRALTIEPEVLLLDEPTASLDPASTQGIEKRLKQARDQAVKIILVTHDLGQAQRLANDVLFLHKGDLLEHSKAEQFFNTPASTEALAYLNGQLLL